jgi:hypothetical protein
MLRYAEPTVGSIEFDQLIIRIKAIQSVTRELVTLLENLFKKVSGFQQKTKRTARLF